LLLNVCCFFTSSPQILRRSEEAANIKQENPNRAKVVNGLEFDFDHHQIVSNPTRGRLFHVGDSDKVSAKAATVTALRVYRDHDKNARQFTVRIARGRVTPLLAAWVPVFLRTSGDVAIASYDPDKLWLQVELKNQTVWIRSDESFRAIGLDHLAAVK
jgi:hypothetical protein